MTIIPPSERKSCLQFCGVLAVTGVVIWIVYLHYLVPPGSLVSTWQAMLADFEWLLPIVCMIVVIVCMIKMAIGIDRLGKIIDKRNVQEEKVEQLQRQFDDLKRELEEMKRKE